MKWFLKVITTTVILSSLVACSNGSPSLKEVETAMKEEYGRVYSRTNVTDDEVSLKELHSCEKNEETGVFICVVRAQERMAMSKDGKDGALIEVAIRKDGSKWVTVPRDE